MSYIVIDTNKILAAILTPGKVRRLLFVINTPVISPRYALEEATRHIVKIARKRGRSPETLIQVLAEVWEELIAEETPKEPHTQKARAIASGFDPDDWPFIALALEYGAPIWTNDAEMIKNSLEHREYKALDTRGLEMLLEGRSWGEVEEYLRERYGG